MASGDIIQKDKWFYHVKLVEGVTGTDNGVWVDLAPFAGAVQYHVTGTPIATIQFQGSNAATRPSAATDGPLLQQVAITVAGVDVFGIVFCLPATQTSGGGATLTVTPAGISGSNFMVMPRWLKVKTTAYTSGTVNVNAIVRMAGS